jgi:hypothetical protein
METSTLSKDEVDALVDWCEAAVEDVYGVTADATHPLVSALGKLRAYQNAIK